MRAAAAASALGLLLAGCLGPASTGVEISHVHGLAFDGTAVYVATHQGVARGQAQDGSWQWSYVGSERFDYMGFTQDAVTPGTFYSSGHPSDPRVFGGVHLGLRRSTDNGQTWEQRSLQGQVDFHALTALATGPGHLAGAWQGNIKLSMDGGVSWKDHPTSLRLLALASSEGTLWAGSTAGLHATTDLADWRQVGAEALSAAVSSVGASPDGKTLLVSTGDGRTGGTHRSLDAGATWAQIPDAVLARAAAPVLFAFDPGDAAHVFASTADATILESWDAGGSWEIVRD